MNEAAEAPQMNGAAASVQPVYLNRLHFVWKLFKLCFWKKCWLYFVSEKHPEKFLNYSDNFLFSPFSPILNFFRAVFWSKPSSAGTVSSLPRCSRPTSYFCLYAIFQLCYLSTLTTNVMVELLIFSCQGDWYGYLKLIYCAFALQIRSWCQTFWTTRDGIYSGKASLFV